MAYVNVPVPFPGGASPVMSPQQFPPPSTTPAPQVQVQPGAITYTTTVDANGQTIYHPFRAIPATYDTSHGKVSGIQWVPADATSVVPAGATPATADIMASFNPSRRQADWREPRDHRRYSRDEEELRRVREKDRERERRQERRLSNTYADVERRLEDLEISRDREHRDPRTGTGTRSRRGSMYGDRPAGYTPAPGGGQYPTAAGGYAGSGASAYGSPPTTYSGGAYTSPNTTYQKPGYAPPSPRPGDIVRSVSPYYAAAPAAPRPVSPYQHPGMQRPVSPYHNPAGMQRPVSPYHGGAAPGRPVSPYHAGAASGRPASPYYGGPMQRTASPRPGVPGAYPSAGVLDGQRPISRAPSPNPRGYPPPSMYTSPGQPAYGAQPSAYGQTPAYGQAPAYGQPGAYGQGGAYGQPGAQQYASAPGYDGAYPAGAQEPMLSAPEGFSRPPNLAQPYTHFEMMKIQEMDDFLEVIPRMPLVLVPHDVYHEDWIRFTSDLAMAWSGRLPVPQYAKDGRPPKRTTLAADLIDLWNTSFFIERGVEVVLFKGRERRSGRNNGVVELHLPGFDTYDPADDVSDDEEDSESDDDEDERYRYAGGPYGYGRGVDNQLAEMREARRIRRERKAEHKRRKMEKRRKERMKEMEKKYTLYLTCISRESGLGPQM